MGRRGGQRDIDGILVLDKAVGISSNRALQQVKRLYEARKAGHCGSLDPLASGVLPICLGQATRFSSYLLGAFKSYRASCRLGITTTTADAEGEVLETRPVEADLAMVESVLPRFRGHIEQVPPMYSALHHDGKRLYQLAREGKQVARAPRPVEIEKLEPVSLDADELVFEVRCSKGTYVRSLAEDIGAALGCGAHLSALRRTAVGDMGLEQAHSFPRLEALAQRGFDEIDALLLPVSAALRQFPELRLEAEDAGAMRHGRPVRVGGDRMAGLYRLDSAQHGFLGLGEVFADGTLKAKRLMNTAG